MTHMTKKLLKLSLLLGVCLAFNTSAHAACVSSDCAAMGYTKTESQCDGGMVRCPFDTSKVFCIVKLCDIATVGSILYSDMSCSAAVYSDKTPIGVIFDPDRRLAMSLAQSKQSWSTTYVEIPNVVKYSSTKKSYAGKSNTKAIVDYCKANGYSCNAATYSYNYTTKGTTAGDWFLPSDGEIFEMYENREKLNTVLQKIGGTTLIENAVYWTSTQEDNKYAKQILLSKPSSGISEFSSLTKNGRDYVRPVLNY